jgi:hypothetical protein
LQLVFVERAADTRANFVEHFAGTLGPISRDLNVGHELVRQRLHRLCFSPHGIDRRGFWRRIPGQLPMHRHRIANGKQCRKRNGSAGELAMKANASHQRKFRTVEMRIPG